MKVLLLNGKFMKRRFAFYIIFLIFIFPGLFFLLGCSKRDTHVDVVLESCIGDDCCSRNQECINQCDNLFTEKEHEEKCQALSKQQVLEMSQTLNLFLKKPDVEGHLEQVELSVLGAVFAISEQSWLHKIHKYSRSQAQAVLFWLVNHIELNTFMIDEYPGAFSSVLKALFKKNTGSSYLDDKSLLAGIKEPLAENGKNFLEIAENKNNKGLIVFVHKEIITGHICDYSINQPRQVSGLNDDAYEACILGVYCYITGSYNGSKPYEGRDYAGRNRGQKVRKMLAGEIEEERIEIFIEKDVDKGGLGIQKEADEWPDTACVKLAELWEDDNLYFGL